MRWLKAGLLVAAGGLGQNLQSPLILNADHIAVNLDPDGVAMQPAFAFEPGGALTAVWVNYRHGQERVLAATVQGARVGRNMQLSPGVGVYYRPVIVSTGPDAAWVFWSRFVGGRWQIAGRRKDRGRWQPMEVLSDPGENALKPSAWVAGSTVWLAWEGDRGAEQSVSVRSWNGREWSPGTVVSEPGIWSFRPVLAANTDGAVWVFWDAYVSGRYGVFGRPVHPVPGPVERISDPAQDALKPAALATPDSGLAVAWLGREDVAGKGILDQWFTAVVALRRDGKWRQETVADLRHSLLAQIEPEVEGLYGYQGRRRDPMLAADGRSLWLLWERRILHAGSGVTAGELCGRRFDGRTWSEPRSLHQGLLDYRIPFAASARGGQLAVAAKDLHSYYSVLDVDLTRGKPFRFGEWPGWRVVRLPLRPDPVRPASAIIEDRRHALYWADLHVHSGLTADAEGEVDELMHFARDRARLDAVVIQENDFIRRPLAAGEYALSVYWAGRFNEPGRFVAIPGFEWTHRPDDNKPNHRTVLYAGEETPIVRHTENNGNFDELCDMVEAAGGVMNTQHETFRWTNRACEGNIEVASGWRVFIRNPAFIHAALSAGARAGFVATSDGHRRNPGTGGGLTGLWLPELTRATVIDALKRRRVYATNGSRIVVEARANGAFMGQDLAAPDGRAQLTLRVAAPRTIARAVLIRDGREALTVPGAGPVLEHVLTDRLPPGDHWYYWRIELEGGSPDFPANLKAAEGHWAWSSPHRVRVQR